MANPTRTSIQMSRTRRAFQWLLAAFFFVSGILHFARTDFYLRLMPPYVPAHRELVYLSGVIESGLGVLLLIPRYTRLAAWGLIATLIAIFPANLHAALTAGTPEAAMPGAPLWHWLRLPLQAVFIAWAYWFTRPADASS
jgi:uncharacterized membrane protein